MSAVVKAIGGTVAKAAASWDPIGHFIVTNDVSNALKILEPVEKFSEKWDPIAPLVHKAEQGLGEAITKDPVLQWTAETVNEVGTSIDDGIRDIGVDPNTVKMAVASTALTLTGQAWAIPLLNAAMVKAQGGSWEDMALAAATSYVASAAGAYVGDYVSSTITGGTAVTAGQVSAQAAKAGIEVTARQAADIAAKNAAALGFGTTFTANALSNMAAAGVSNATAQLIRTGSVDVDRVLQTAATAGVTTGVSALTKQIPGFNQLPDAAQKTINQTLASTVQGKQVNMDALQTALMTDMATAAMKDFYQNGFKTVEALYNQAAQKFNWSSAFAHDQLDMANQLRDRALAIQASVEEKAQQVNALVDTANATRDSSIVPQIAALKAEITVDLERRDELVRFFNSAKGGYETYLGKATEELPVVLERRADVFDTLAKSIDPEFDAAAFMFLNPDAAKDMYSAGTYGTGQSAAETFLVKQSEDPNTPLITSWREGFLVTAPDKFDAVAEGYKQATGFDLTPELAKTDFATYAAYQTGLANTTQDLLAKAAEAENAGDSTKYAELMSQALQRASDENLGWVKRDDSGNYIWGNQVYDNQGVLVGDYTPPEGTTPDLMQEDYQKYAQSLYGVLDSEKVTAAQEAAQTEAAKRELEKVGYKATTQEEAEKLAAGADTYKDLTGSAEAYAKEHTVTSEDVMKYLKDFNYEKFFKGLTPYIGQGAQYEQAKLAALGQQEILRRAMQYGMQQGTRFTPATYTRVPTQQVPTGATGTTGANAAGLAALLAMAGGASAVTAGGTAPAAPQVQLRSTGITPYSDSAAAATGQVGMGQLLRQETQFVPQQEEPVQQHEFGDIQPISEEQDDSMDYFRAGGVVPNVTFGYADQVQAMAEGGIAALPRKNTGSDLGSYSDGGQLLRGPGTGLSDNIPATIDRNQPARLASGEFVVPADVVSALGGGSTEAGAKILYEMLDRIRHQAHGSKQQIKKVNPAKVLPK